MPNFPQLEWINVDGKLVPSTKPQHYKKGSITETELTGHDNPLPVEDDAVKQAVKDLELALNELDIPDADYTSILNKLDEINASVVDNKIDFPENQKVSDDLVLAKLNELEAEIKEIKTRMDGTFNTQLIGSNVEDGLPVKSVGDKVVEKQLLGREIRNAFTQSFDTNVDPTVKRIVIVLNVYGVTGTFDSGEGYSLGIRKHTRDTVQAYDVARTKFSTTGGNYGGVLITIDPTVGDKINGQSDNYLLVQDTLFPSYRIMLYVDGVFGEGEGVDCDVSAYYIY